MVRVYGFLQNSTGRIQMDSRTWSQISDPAVDDNDAAVDHSGCRYQIKDIYYILCIKYPYGALFKRSTC